MKHIRFWSLLLVFILSACGRAPAPEPTLDTLAAVINVNTTVDEWNSPIANDKCSLREAIISANENSDFGGCTHTGTYGGDTINLPAGTYRLTRNVSGLFGIAAQDQDYGDLNVTSPIDLRGNGAGTTTIEANFNVISEYSRVLRVGSEQIPNPNVFFAIRRLKITGGDTYDIGGGLLLRSGSIVEDVIVEGNIASQGGGIYSCDGFTIRRTTIRGNTSSDSGGGSGRGGGIGMDCAGGEFSIVNSTISGNSAATRGGGLALSGGTFTITNSTFSGNFASDRAGAIRADGGIVNLLNVTITNNSAGDFQGGISRGGGSFILSNTIVSGNSAPEQPDCGGSFGSSGNNFVGIVTGSCTGFSSSSNDIRGSTTSPVNPQLGPLADNGGATRTHALLPGSPALDVANPSTCPTTDQRNTARPLDGNNDGVLTCDIGAFELANPAKADLSMSLSDSADPVALGSSFNYTATLTNAGPDRSANTRIEFTVNSAMTILSIPSGCTRSGNVVTCRVGDSRGFVNNGSSVSRTISVRAPTTGTTNIDYLSRAWARSSTPEPSNSNNLDLEPTRITPGTADLTVFLNRSASTVLAGSSFNYELVFGNLGPQTAQNVTATINLPAGLSISSLDGCTQPSTLVVSCNVASLASGAGVSKTISVNAPNSPGTLTANATVSATGPTDPVSSNNSDSVNVTVSLPATDMNVAIPAPTQNSNAPRNTDMTYQVRVRNTLGTPALAQNVVLTVTFPNTVSNIQAPAGCTLNNFVVTCNIGLVSAGAIVAKNITVRLPNAATSVAVNASITLSNPDPNTGNNQLTRTINVQ